MKIRSLFFIIGLVILNVLKGFDNELEIIGRLVFFIIVGL